MVTFISEAVLSRTNKSSSFGQANRWTRVEILDVSYSDVWTTQLGEENMEIVNTLGDDGKDLLHHIFRRALSP